MQLSYVGLHDGRGPLGVFLFVGPSGVGKTGQTWVPRDSIP
jgi:ATP-dependent Clp protease ATP-binding subunit ClpA